jgi:hypothetical protein
METKRENGDETNGRHGSVQLSPKKLITKFPVIIILDLNLSQDKWQRFCDSPTIKTNVTHDDMLNSAQRHEGMWEERGYNSTRS